MSFMDHRGNRIEMYPVIGSVLAYPRSGKSLILGIPDGYKKYHLQIPNSINLSPAEVDYIYQWKMAAEITILEQNDLPYRLSMRQHKMKAMTQLWRLEFSVHQGTFAKLMVSKFLKRMPAIELISVHVEGLTAGQIGRFITNQRCGSGWKVTCCEKIVEFRKVDDKANGKDCETTEKVKEDRKG